MSAEILRRAAADLRAEWDGPNPMGTAWHRERDFHLAVADLLDACAKSYHPDFRSLRHDGALAVARAYLGSDA